MILQALKIRQRGRSLGPASEETTDVLGRRAVHKTGTFSCEAGRCA